MSEDSDSDVEIVDSRLARAGVRPNGGVGTTSGRTGKALASPSRAGVRASMTAAQATPRSRPAPLRPSYKQNDHIVTRAGVGGEPHQCPFFRPPEDQTMGPPALATPRRPRAHAAGRTTTLAHKAAGAPLSVQKPDDHPSPQKSLPSQRLKVMAGKAARKTAPWKRKGARMTAAVQPSYEDSDESDGSAWSSDEATVTKKRPRRARSPPLPPSSDPHTEAQKLYIKHFLHPALDALLGTSRRRGALPSFLSRNYRAARDGRDGAQSRAPLPPAARRKESLDGLLARREEEEANAETSRCSRQIEIDLNGLESTGSHVPVRQGDILKVHVSVQKKPLDNREVFAPVSTRTSLNANLFFDPPVCLVLPVHDSVTSPRPTSASIRISLTSSSSAEMSYTLSLLNSGTGSWAPDATESRWSSPLTTSLNLVFTRFRWRLDGPVGPARLKQARIPAFENYEELLEVSEQLRTPVVKYDLEVPGFDGAQWTSALLGHRCWCCPVYGDFGSTERLREHLEEAHAHLRFTLLPSKRARSHRVNILVIRVHPRALAPSPTRPPLKVSMTTELVQATERINIASETERESDGSSPPPPRSEYSRNIRRIRVSSPELDSDVDAEAATPARPLRRHASASGPDLRVKDKQLPRDKRSRKAPQPAVRGAAMAPVELKTVDWPRPALLDAATDLVDWHLRRVVPDPNTLHEDDDPASYAWLREMIERGVAHLHLRPAEKIIMAAWAQQQAENPMLGNFDAFYRLDLLVSRLAPNPDLKWADFLLFIRDIFVRTGKLGERPMPQVGALRRRWEERRSADAVVGELGRAVGTLEL